MKNFTIGLKFVGIGTAPSLTTDQIIYALHNVQH